MKCCIYDDYDYCEECPYRKNKPCQENLIQDAFDLINRQKAELERLEKHTEMYHELRAEAFNEFAERFLKKVHDNHYLLSDRVNSKDYGMFTVGIEQAVNETKEEMAGEG